MEMVKLGAICDEAKEIINGARQEEYGTPADSFARVAEYWNTHIHHTKTRDNYMLTSKDVAIMMILFKIAREENQHKHDNLTDIIGYTALLDYMHEAPKVAEKIFNEKIKNMVKGYTTALTEED